MAVDRVRAALRAAGLNVEIREFSASTRTAEDAARALGVVVGQIVKSLVFLADGHPILALVSGANRVNEAKLAAASGAGRVFKAAAETVREVTGFPIGGVPPLGHRRALRTFLDQDLLRHDLIYAAAGTPQAVFPLTPQQLLQVTGAQPVDLRQS